LHPLLHPANKHSGGSVLAEILKSPAVQNATISALVRRQDQAEILRANGVSPIIFEGLDDLVTLEEVSSDFDVVINCANGFHSTSAVALIKGLAKRKAKSGKEVHFIHVSIANSFVQLSRSHANTSDKPHHVVQTSGTSNLGDYRISGAYTETRIFTDRDHIYAYEKYREDMVTYPQRTTELAVIDTGLATSVRTYIIMSPTIYGPGSGLFNKISIQIPTLMRTAVKVGHAEVVGAGDAYWDHVHIADLASLYEVLLGSVLERKEGLAFGKQGIYFSETGEHTWMGLAEGVARAGFELGVLQSPMPARITLQQSAEQWGKGSLQFGELGWCSS
jgi:nucleoside-diphosphate-sugar epimerase